MGERRIVINPDETGNQTRTYHDVECGMRESVRNAIVLAVLIRLKSAVDEGAVAHA